MIDKLKLRLRQAIFTFFLILLVWTGFSAWSIFSFGNYVNDAKADGIIVLGAAVWGDRPSPVFRERINHAINLYKKKYATTVIFTGGKSDGDELAEAETAKQYAAVRGVASDSILIETLSKSTEQNLYYAKQLAINHNLATVIIVSDPLHMKRAVLIAEDLGLKAYSSPTPTTRYRSFHTKLRFLVRETYFYQRYLLRRLFYSYYPSE